MSIHKSVLLQQAIDGLDIKKGDVFVDGTLGGGGHIEEVCKRFGGAVVMIGIDLDPLAISRTKERLAHFGPPAHDEMGGRAGLNIRYIEGSFRNIDTLLDSVGTGQVDKIILDIGLSSNQFEESGRGFSFQKNEPLIMSFKPVRPLVGGAGGESLKEGDLTAREIVNVWDEENIRAILEGYGEERIAYKIGTAIVAARNIKPIETTFDLVEIIKSATPAFYHHRKIHPATKTFQALRITVNDEIESLKDGIRKGFKRLNGGGRLAVISFHSIEDRTVKIFFKEKEDGGEAKRVTKKPIIPTDEEIEQNPRSRSAKLRIIQKI